MNDVEIVLCKFDWNEEEINGQSWPSNLTLHKIIQNSSIFG
jgi:hypothetical protein